MLQFQDDYLSHIDCYMDRWCCAVIVMYAKYIAQNKYPWLLGMTPLCHIPLKTANAQLHIKKVKPVCTDGINDIDRPSDDKSCSFCVSNPHPSPTSKLKVGPAKHAAILISASPLCARVPLVV